MRIPIALQLAILAVAMTGFYTMVGQAVPQKEVHPPEVIEIAADVSIEEMVEIGKEIYDGKGICYTCHANTSRYPDMQGVAVRAATRIPGYTALDYLAESLYEPEAYIVEGFNPGMPVINKPPIGLTDQEILAVIAYLQTLGGEPTVTMETKLVYTGGTRESEAGAAGAEVAAVTDGADAADLAAAVGSPALLATMGCEGCHAAGGEAAPLEGLGARHAAADIYLLLSQHRPGGGYERLTVADLQALVEFFVAEGGA